MPPQSVPDFSKAFSWGTFLKPEKTLVKVVLAHEGILPPPPPPPPWLLPRRICCSSLTSRSCQLPDRVVTEWEEVAWRGLETASVMDGFLGGLVEAVRDPDLSLEGFHLRADLDPAQICFFARSVAQGLRFLSSSLAKLHTNCVLARRDAVLFSSPIAVSSGDRASVRAVPVADGSLFWRNVRPFLKYRAELRRETSLTPYPGRKPPKRPASETATSASFSGRPSGGCRPSPLVSLGNLRWFPNPGVQSPPLPRGLTTNNMPPDLHPPTVAPL